MTLLAQLLAINPDSPRRPTEGICCHIESLHHKKLRDLMDRWPKRTGFHAYPVPHPDYPDTPVTAYFNSPNLWTGPYGDNRRELLQFCIDRLLDDDLHEALTKLKTNGPELVTCGICSNLPFSSQSHHWKRLQHHFTNWPSYSGHPSYPIEGSDAIYSANLHKWFDPRRHELLEFLLEQTK